MVPWTYLSQCPKLHVDQYSCFCIAYGRECLYFTMGRPFPLENCPLSWRNLNPDPIHGSLGLPLPESTPQNGILIVSAIFAWLVIMTDRLTDHATPSAVIGCINVVRQCSLKMRTMGWRNTWITKWKVQDLEVNQRTGDRLLKDCVTWQLIKNNALDRGQWRN